MCPSIFISVKTPGKYEVFVEFQTSAVIRNIQGNQYIV